MPLGKAKSIGKPEENYYTSVDPKYDGLSFVVCFKPALIIGCTCLGCAMTDCLCLGCTITGCLCLGWVYTTSYTGNPSTGNQLYRQSKHRQPVIQAAQAQATRYTVSPSTGNQLYKQRKHRQPVIQAAQTQATSYKSSSSTGNQLYMQPKHRGCRYNWLPVLGLPV